MKQPPLGLVPRWFRTEQRLAEINEAMKRYLAANYPLPPEWVEEYNELTNWLSAYLKSRTNV